MSVSAARNLGQGVFQVRIPLPFPSPKYVNSYVFETDRGLTVLDCGVNTAEGRAALDTALDEIGGTLTRLIGSHLHVDHIGMAKQIVTDTGAEFVMHSSTPEEVIIYNDWELRRSQMAALARRHGAPQEFAAKMESAWERPDWYDDAMNPTQPVDEGDQIPLGPGRFLEVYYTPGHQANHICLVDSRTGILYSGDHVLPRISPFVPYAGPATDTLGHYLDSIRKVEALDVDLTHPAHGAEIERGSDRAAQIGVHHQRRLETMLDELRPGPKTAWEIMEASFRPHLTFVQQRLAIQETLSHLTHLAHKRLVVEEADGKIHRFRRLR